MLVLGFFVVVWIAFVAILVVSPDVYAQTLRLAPGDLTTIEVVFLVVLSALIATLVVGVLRRWRWTFWLILVAFVFGVLRVQASALQLVGLIGLKIADIASAEQPDTAHPAATTAHI